MALPMVVWLLRGRARIKAEVARRAAPDVETLPFQREFLQFLADSVSAGREVWLATASDTRVAVPVANSVGLFKGVIASDGVRNLRGDQKLQEILTHSVGGVFDYAGNATADFSIWKRARRAIIVNPGAGVEAGARARCDVQHLFDDRPPAWQTWIREARIYQWLKNTLIGVPMLTAHVVGFENIVAVAVAFFAFGLVASATYMLNDLLDLSSDRRHPRKRRRPFAAGDLSVAGGVVTLVGMLAVGFALAMVLPPMFRLALAGYLVTTVAYSTVFKTYALFDVLLLAGLYTLRILAGALAIRVPVSFWLLAFSMFLFLSLALVKRASELLAMSTIEGDQTKGRDYRRGDAQTIVSLGTSAGYLSALVLALYIDSAYVTANYSRPELLWLLCPLLLYWVSRLWMKTTRGEMHDDPIVFSLRDRGSWASFVLMGVVVFAAI